MREQIRQPLVERVIAGGKEWFWGCAVKQDFPVHLWRNMQTGGVAPVKIAACGLVAEGSKVYPDNGTRPVCEHCRRYVRDHAPKEIFRRLFVPDPSDDTNPVERVERIDYSASAGVDGMAWKRALVAALDNPVVGVYLQPPCKAPETPHVASERADVPEYLHKLPAVQRGALQRVEVPEVKQASKGYTHGSIRPIGAILVEVEAARDLLNAALAEAEAARSMLDGAVAELMAAYGTPGMPGIWGVELERAG